MFVHYLASALSNFRKTPFTTAANVVTLALGLACLLAAFGIATYWTSADRHHANAARTVVVGQSLKPRTDEDAPVLRPASTATLAKYLRQDVPELERIARLFPQGEAAVSAGERKALFHVTVAEPDVMQIFDFDFVAGDNRALDAPGSVVLTRDAAERLFPDGPALGRTILIAGNREAVVTGVIAPVRQPSFMGASADSPVRFDMLETWSSHPGGRARDERDFWTGFSAMTVATLAPGATLEAVNARLPALVERRMPPQQRGMLEMKLAAFPASEVTVRALDNTLFGESNLDLTAVATLLGLGFLTLFVACLNYANLAAAQASARSGEFGMRRVMGANRLGLFAQFAVETLVLAIAALVIALAALAAAAPPLRSAANIDLLHYLGVGPGPWVMLAGLVLGVTVIAGAYPALVLSRAPPAAAIKRKRGSSGSRTAAHVLVGVQFASASFLLIMVTIAGLQRAELQQAATQGLSDPVVSLGDLRTVGVDYDTLRAQLQRSPNIEQVTVTEWGPWSGSSNLGMFARSPESAARTVTAHQRRIGFDYFETLGLDLLAGRVFDRAQDIPEDTVDPATTAQGDVVLSDGLAKALGFASPEAAVGKMIFVPERLGREARPLRVIGVTKEQLQGLETDGSQGALYHLSEDAPYAGRVALVRISGANARAALDHIERVWSELAPAAPVNVRFYDQLFDQAYRRYARIGQLFMLLSVVTFAIASTGLLGIAVHVAALRRREVAVRKIVGSTTWGAVRLLLSEFSRPVFVANLMTWPLAYLAAETYLSAFAHRIELTLWPFAVSMAITLLIAWLAVGGQAFKTARVRPAMVLREA